MANTTRSANAYKQYNGSSWGSWRSLSGGDLVPLPIGTTNYPAWRYSFGSAVRITQISFQLGIDGSGDIGYPYSLTASLYKDDPATGSPVATDTQTFSLPDPDPVTFTFQSLTLDTTSNFYIVVKYNRDPAGGEFIGDARSATITYSAIPALTPSIVQPRGGSISVGTDTLFSWQSSGAGTQTKAQLQWSSNGSTWQSLATISGNGQTWQSGGKVFPQGTTYWRIRLTSSYGVVSEWVQASFTTAYNPAVVTLTTPTSGSKDGGQQIAFAWTIAAGSGTVNGTQMAYSTDGGLSWTNLVNSSSQATGYIAPAGKFPAGQLKWRVRARDSYSGWGAWEEATITITYAGAVVTLTAPTSGSKDGGQQIAFAWTIAAGSGTVNGTQMAYSTDGGLSWTNLVNSSSQATGYIAPAGKFPAGQLKWRVRASDSYSGWGAWEEATITITYAGAVVTLTTPTSGSKDGGQQIAFAWTIAAGSGSISDTQMEYTSDDGITWTSLVNSSSSVTSYNAPAGKFPAGAIKWRVRARDSFAGWGEWKQAAITITYALAVVTLTTPTSGSLDGAEVINFAWTIAAGSGTVTGTQMEISSDDGITWQSLIDSDGTITSYASTVAQFPAGRMLWHVRAKDSYSGWGAWKQATITVTYSAVSQVVAVNSPTSGVYNAAAARTFTVRLDASGPVHTPFQIQEASFFWRSGESGEFTELAMTPGGNTAAVEIPAGTFPSGRIEWYASATDTTGRTTETPHYVLTALQTAVEAAPLSPINTIESGSGPITFRWTYGSLDGAPQGRAQLQYSRDGETWTDEHIFADITGEQTTYIAEQGTFPGGSIFWRVRSYNDAGTAGPWSAAVSFSSYSAPLVTGVTGDGKPFATITWQSDGQEAYEIEVGGKTHGPYYGADVRSFTLPEPLPDGEYTVRVRAQNKMTLWSQWIEGQMSVVNVPTESLWIMADSGENVHLRVFIGTLAPTILKQPQDAQGTSGEIYFIVGLATTQPGTTRFGQRQWYVKDPGGDWQPFTGTGATSSSMHFTAAQELDGRQIRCRIYNDVGEIYTRTATYHYAAPNMKIGETITGEFHAETGYFLVYRDGTLIGKTYNTFDDRTALGEHQYRYVQVLPGGYYNSDTATGTASVSCPAIAPLEGGDFLSLKLSENSDREVRITEAREVEWTQYAGADYPSAEIGEGKSKAVALDVSALMSDEDFAKAFTALLGKDVIVKTPDGTVVIGPLESLDLRAPRSHRSWTFGVTQMEWSDFIDES